MSHAANEDIRKSQHPAESQLRTSRQEVASEATLLMSTVVGEVWFGPEVDLRRIKVSQFSGPPVLSLPCSRFFPHELSTCTPTLAAECSSREKRSIPSYDPLIRGFARVKYLQLGSERKLPQRDQKVSRAHFKITSRSWICIMRHALTDTMDFSSLHVLP